MKLKESFSTRLTISVTAISLIVFFIFCLLMGVMTFAMIRQEAQKNAFGQLEQMSQSVSQSLQEAQQTSDYLAGEIAGMLSEPVKNWAELQSMTSQMMDRYPFINLCCISLDPKYCGADAPSPSTQRFGDGTITTVNGLSFDELSRTDWYKQVRKSHKAGWTDPYISDITHRRVMTSYVVPVMNKNKEMVGAMCVNINPDWVYKVLSSHKIFQDAFPILVSSTGVYAVHPDEKSACIEMVQDRANRLKNNSLVQFGKQIIANEKGTSSFVRNGISYVAFYVPFKPMEWTNVMVCRTEVVYGNELMLIFWMSIFIVVAIIVVYIVVSSRVRKFTKPLEYFVSAARKIGNGKFDEPLPEIYSRDEIRDLRDAFVFMQQSLLSNTAQLKATTLINHQMEVEMSLARKMQLDMVPQTFPKRKDVDMYAVLNPARESSGNLYHFALDDDMLYFSIGDVSGKGISSTLFMLMTYNLLFTALSSRLSPAKIVKFANNVMAKNNTTSMYVTIFVGRLDLKTGELTYCNAGHDAPIVLAPDGSLTELAVEPNLAVGVLDGFDYVEQHIMMPSDTAMVIYTDGVIEAEDSNGQFYGLNKLKQLLRQRAGENCQQIITMLKSDVKNFTQDSMLDDDITALALRYKPKP